jgi:hypothetical protein
MKSMRVWWGHSGLSREWESRSTNGAIELAVLLAVTCALIYLNFRLVSALPLGPSAWATWLIVSVCIALAVRATIGGRTSDALVNLAAVAIVQLSASVDSHARNTLTDTSRVPEFRVWIAGSLAIFLALLVAFSRFDAWCARLWHLSPVSVALPTIVVLAASAPSQGVTLAHEWALILLGATMLLLWSLGAYLWLSYSWQFSRRWQRPRERIQRRLGVLLEKATT